MIRLKTLLQEIGEASGSKYKWKQEISGDLNQQGEKQSYSFVTDSGLNYRVDLENHFKFISVSFEANGTFDATNRGEMFSVMATIVDIIKSALKNLNIGSDSTTDDVLGLKYTPSQKGKDRGSKRDNLYIAYIKKAFPNSEVIQMGGYHTFIKFK